MAEIVILFGMHHPFPSSILSAKLADVPSLGHTDVQL